MKIDDTNPDIVRYYKNLPPKIKNQLDASKADVSTLGELMLITEYYNQKEKTPYDFNF
jgi:hypothetical protein